MEGNMHVLGVLPMHGMHARARHLHAPTRLHGMKTHMHALGVLPMHACMTRMRGRAKCIRIHACMA